jgi:hypothetical protein
MPGVERTMVAKRTMPAMEALFLSQQAYGK